MNLTLVIGLATLFLMVVAILQAFILAGQARARSDAAELWRRVNHHSHVVHCPSPSCNELTTNGVVIEES